MSLVNWEEHRARFIALREEKGITVKEYCEEHGLSFNTARKHLNMKKNEVRSQVKTTKKSTKSPEKKRAGRATKKLEEGAEKTKFTEIDNSQGAGSFRSMPRKKTSDHESNANNNNEIKESVRRSLREKMAKMIPEEDKSAPKIEGSSAMIPGGAVQRATLPTTNVARDMMKNGAEEHLRLAIQMAQERALQYQSIVDQEAERLQAEIDALGDKEPEGMHPGQRLLGLISDAAYYMNDFISRLAAIYQSEQKLRQGDEKLRQSARQQAFKEAEAREKLELARLQAEQRGKEIEYRIGADARAARVIAAAIRMREREELDDIGVAEYIERQGVSVPAILAARAAKAITLLEPPVSDVMMLMMNSWTKRQGSLQRFRLTIHNGWQSAGRMWQPLLKNWGAEITTAMASVKLENSRPTTKSWILTLRQRLKFTVIMMHLMQGMTPEMMISR